MDFVTSFISLLYLISVLSTSLGDECTTQDTCKCKASSYTIDLDPLNSGSNPRFSSPSGDYIYYYQPCVALSGKCVIPGASPDTAVCQTSSGGAEYDAGDATSGTFSGDADAGTLKLTYKADTRTSVISLQCSCAEGDFSFVDEKPQNQYNFVLKTIHACGSTTPNCGPDKTKHGLSTGSVLLILFFVFLTVYFVAGILFLKFARGAQGKEMVPNYEFWTAIPGLVKEGVQFTCRGCKTDSSYSQI